LPAYRIIILEEAISEITESCLYYNENSPGLGLEFEEEVFQLFEKIEDNPLLFPIKFASIHEAVLTRFPFVITYEVFGKQIIILAVFHTKRNPDKKIKKRRK
jgi:plasmid stabilization system protein ParE